MTVREIIDAHPHPAADDRDALVRSGGKNGSYRRP